MAVLHMELIVEGNQPTHSVKHHESPLGVPQIFIISVILQMEQLRRGGGIFRSSKNIHHISHIKEGTIILTNKCLENFSWGGGTCNPSLELAGKIHFKVSVSEE